MKKLLFIGLLSLLFACTQNKEQKDEVLSEHDYVAPAVKTGAFYETALNEDNSVIIADTIIYSVVTKNPNPEDDWTEYCLHRVDQEALANIIFNAIYNGRLTAYDYYNDEPMSIEAVRTFEKENPRNKIANVQFVEEWYFDEKNLKMGKRVNAIMLAYELRNNKDEVKGYKAGVKVYLDNGK